MTIEKENGNRQCRGGGETLRVTLGCVTFIFNTKLVMVGANLVGQDSLRIINLMLINDVTEASLP